MIDAAEARHIGGTAWHAAPLPPRDHRCRVQTYGWVEFLTRVERCPCGATRVGDHGAWTDRNSRRRTDVLKPLRRNGSIVLWDRVRAPR